MVTQTVCGLSLSLARSAIQYTEGVGFTTRNSRRLNEGVTYQSVSPFSSQRLLPIPGFKSCWINLDGVGGALVLELTTT